ncbi:MAG: PBSX family phage terminase large subunit [Oscillospiraceae bacterium]
MTTATMGTTALQSNGPALVIKSKAKFNPTFRQVNATRRRYRILKGSAGSGKSVNIAQDYIIKLSDPAFDGANLLVVRKVDDTNRDSTFAELQAAIYKIFGDQAERVWKINQSPLYMECKITGNRIIFRGMNDYRQREKIKSVAFKTGKLVWIWVEEATELLVEDIDILDDRLRGDLSELNPNLYYQITLTFNPVSATHWIKGRYFDKASNFVMTHHSTYKDNKFIDFAYYQRMERRKTEDPEGYRVYGLGEWGELGGLILSNYHAHNFARLRENFDDFVLAQDFGFNHANVVLEVGFKDGEIYICRELVCHEMDTSEIIKAADKQKFCKTAEMICDSAEPDRIQMWSKAGYRAVPVSKETAGKGSVSAQIDYLKARKIHIHPSCVHTLKEIGQWKWKKDKSTGLYIDEPVAFFDDAMAALRYSVERQRKGAAIEIMK